MAIPLHHFPDMNAKFLVPIALAALLVASGCSTLADLAIQNPEYRILDIRPRVDLAIPFSASTIDIDFAIDIDNPNAVGLNLDRLDFDLMMNGTRVLSGISNENIRIPANGAGRLDLRTSMGYRDIRTIFSRVVEWVQGGDPEYEIRGTAYFDTPVGQLRFPVTVYRAGRGADPPGH